MIWHEAIVRTSLQKHPQQLKAGSSQQIGTDKTVNNAFEESMVVDTRLSNNFLDEETKGAATKSRTDRKSSLFYWLMLVCKPTD